MIKADNNWQQMIKTEQKLPKIYILNITIYWLLEVHGNLVSNLSEEIYKIKCKSEHDDVLLYCDCFLEYKDFKII